MKKHHKHDKDTNTHSDNGIVLHVSKDYIANTSEEELADMFSGIGASLKEIVEATTQNDWKGPDAELFVNNTKAKIEKLNDEYTEFLDQLMALINENHDVFKETQQRNINMQE